MHSQPVATPAAPPSGGLTTATTNTADADTAAAAAATAAAAAEALVAAGRLARRAEQRPARRRARRVAVAAMTRAAACNGRHHGGDNAVSATALVARAERAIAAVAGGGGGGGAGGVPPPPPAAAGRTSARADHLATAHAALSLAAAAAATVDGNDDATNKAAAAAATRLALIEDAAFPTAALRAASQTSVDTVVVPLLERALLRDTQAALRTVHRVLDALGDHVDLARFAEKPLGTALIDAAHSSAEPARLAAIRLAAALAFRVHPAAAAATTTTTTTTTTIRVDGDDHPLAATAATLRAALTCAKYAYQRTAAAAVLAALCKHASSDVTRVFVADALSAVTAWIVLKKETGEDARAAGVESFIDLLVAAAHASRIDALATTLPTDSKSTANGTAAALPMPAASPGSMKAELTDTPALIAALSKARDLLADLVLPKSREVERRAAINCLASRNFPVKSCFGLDPRNTLITEHLENSLVRATCALAVSPAKAAAKAEDSLKACAVILSLLHSNCLSDLDFSSLSQYPDIMTIAGSVEKSPVLQTAVKASTWVPHSSESAAFALATACRCALLLFHYRRGDSCAGADFSSTRPWLCSALLQLATDVRPVVAKHALQAVQGVRASGGDTSANDLLSALWLTGLGSSDKGRAAALRQQDDFDDGGVDGERCAHALFACVLPQVPAFVAPLALLAAHHPRIHHVPSRARTYPVSRCWAVLQAALPRINVGDLPLTVIEAAAPGSVDGDVHTAVDVRHDTRLAMTTSDVIQSNAAAVETQIGDSWIVECLRQLISSDGLASDQPALVESSVVALAGLLASRKDDAIALFRFALPMLQSLTHAASKLSTEHWDALEYVQNIDMATGAALVDAEISSVPSGRGKSLKGKSLVRHHSQAKGGNAAVVAAEKLERNRKLAAEAAQTVSRTTAALRSLELMCRASPHSARIFCPGVLSACMPSAKVPCLETVCRRLLLALAETAAEASIRSKALEISSTLYGLEAQSVDIEEAVASLVHWLKDQVSDTPLSAEGFALIAPIVKEAMLLEPAPTETGRTAAARTAANAEKRESIAITRSGAQILCTHCKPDAIDAAISAAAARAGVWALAVLEREDAAFGVASEALAYLTGTALSPLSNLLSQVLGGVISGKSSVREASLLALERLPALSESTVSCPRDPILGRTLWLACHDPDKDNASIARDLWNEYDHSLNIAEDAPAMLVLLAHKELDVRIMTAQAMARSLSGDDGQACAARALCVPQMFSMYLKKLPFSMGGLRTTQDASPVQGHRQRSQVHGARPGHQTADMDVDDEWHARHGVALALRDLADCGALTKVDIPVVFAFLASRGLGDLHDEVRAQMSAAAIAVVQSAGELGPVVLLPMIERQLTSSLSVERVALDDGAELGKLQDGVLNGNFKVAHADRTRENLVMCLGGVASFLPTEDPRKVKSAEQVIRTAIGTPSESVQNAAARCLVALAPAAVNGNREQELRNMLTAKLWDSNATYGERRGASYALAGIVRGLGLQSIKRMGLMQEFLIAAEDKDARRRQGAFVAMETLAIMLGRLYEPYTVRALPIMLVAMGDSVVEVRDACWAAAQASMAEVSSQGVQMILPALLSGLKERQWRTKAGAAEVLGAMAFCAPRQLSQCLPQVVPQLADALADAHPKVVAAAESAINRIAAVVRSPEVRNLSRFLLAALRDPAGRTQGALDALLDTEFVHAIDPASLSLLIPPLHRGLRDRSTEMKKRAAAIVGSMCNNVSNHEDVIPYLDLLLPDLRITLLDAIPDVRRTSALALGALAVSLGEKGLPGIVPWLIAAVLSGARSSKDSSDSRNDSVKSINVPATPVNPLQQSNALLGSISVSSSAERSGVAMGLAEVCAALSDIRIEDVLKRVLHAGQSSTPAREGGLMLLASLPRALGERFEDRLPLALSSILLGLSDDSDNVREAALDAGRKTVSAYAKTSLEVLLPEILSAMRDKLWRIRCAATQLLGDLLLTIAGAVTIENKLAAGNDAVHAESDSEDGQESDVEKEGSGDASDGEDDVIDSPEMMAAVMTLEATMKAIEDVLGMKRRNEVLAALFIVRCDVSVRVRQMGMQVWKTVVSNTPRTLREIMPNAIAQVVDALSDEDDERRAAAGKALGDLSQKLGDRVVPEVLPALQAGIRNKGSSARVRLGACDGLLELVAACPKEQLIAHSTELLDTAAEALCDSSPLVRASGAEVFSTLLKPLGSVAINTVIPTLISKIASTTAAIEGEQQGRSDDADRALDGLKQVLHASGTRLLSIVIPRLVEDRPLTIASCRALAASAAVAESEITPYLTDIVDAMVLTIEAAEQDSSSESMVVKSLEELLGAVSSASNDSGHLLLEKVFPAFNDVHIRRRKAAGHLCSAFCRGSKSDVVAGCAAVMLEVLIRQLTDSSEEVVLAGWHALQELAFCVPSEVLCVHVPIIRQALRAACSGVQVGDPDAVIAGLNIDKGPAPFVPIFTEALLRGSPGLREQAALSIAELVEMTNVKVFSPFVIKVTGPLIRVMSDRLPWQVKAAILRALLRLLQKSSTALRTFAPQLQSTFIKSLSDPNRLVRARSCSALEALVPLQPRVEALVNELLMLGLTASLDGSRAAAYLACHHIFKSAKILPQTAFTSMYDKLLKGLDDDSSSVYPAIARATGSLATRSTSPDVYGSLLLRACSKLESDDVDYEMRVRVLAALGSILAGGNHSVIDIEWKHVERAAAVVCGCLDSTVSDVQCAAGSAAVDLYALLESPSLRSATSAAQRDLLSQLGKLIEMGSSPEVRVGILRSIKRIVHDRPVVIAFLAPALVTCAAETNSGIRIAAERVLRRAFVVAGQGVTNRKNVDAAKSVLAKADQDFVDRRVAKVLAMPDSEDEAGDGEDE